MRVTEERRPAGSGEARPRDAVADELKLALAHLDWGRLDEARAALEHALALLEPLPGMEAAEDAAIEWPAEEAAPLAALDEGELERAFESAEAEADAMLDANRVAEEVLRRTGLDESDGFEPVADVPESPFRTRTLADLLERQGHRDEAEQIRADLEGQEPRAAAGAPEPAIVTLEHWLENLRRKAR